MGFIVHGLINPSVSDAVSWMPSGPGSIYNGQVEGIANGAVSGAIQSVLAHPTNANILYVGTVNGGVWRTNNATAPSPTWTPLTDFQSSLSIGSLAFDPTDPSGNTLVAGIGRYSAFASGGGPRTGMLRSTDGGATWTSVAPGMDGRNISGVAARGNTIVASVNTANTFTTSNIGIFRSTNGGASFTQISQGDGTATGLPGGVTYNLAAHPTNNAILYTSAVFASAAGGQNGIYRSTDTGATWSRVSDPAIDALITNGTNNLEITVGRSGEVYVAVINSGSLAGLFRSPNGNSGSWVQTDRPSTNENGMLVGLNPGGEGSLHFSIVADPTSSTTLYVGGDRQPRTNGDTGTFPNSIGANRFSGRLFRGDTSLAPASQFVHLTHSATLGATGGGTASTSAPHAGSRDMTFAADGSLIQVDSGGIYRRTSPRTNGGDWFSLNGNLQIAEIHSIAYDSVSKTIFAGTQDNGPVAQSTSGSLTWNSLQSGSGGAVAVDVKTRAASNQSIRYFSGQNFGAFRREIRDASGALVSSTFPARSPLQGSVAMSAQFVTPVEVNAADPSRLLFGAANGIYESLDQGNTVSQLTTAAVASGLSSGKTMAYGGHRNGLADPSVLWVASSTDVFVRTTAGGAVARTTADPTNVAIRSLEINDHDWYNAFVLTLNTIFSTDDIGATWSNITGDLLAEGATELRSLEFVDLPSSQSFDLLLVGAGNGVFFASTDNLTQWTELGAGTLPNVPVWDMHYSVDDDILVVGTLGRGAWSIPDFSLVVVPEPSSVSALASIGLLALCRRSTVRRLLSRSSHRKSAAH